MTIIFIGAIIAIIGGLITAYGTYIQNKSSSFRMQSIQEKGEAIGKQTEKQIEEIGNLKIQNNALKANVDSLNEKASEQIKTIVDLSIQNSELSIQLTTATKTLYDNLTGGESFCEIYIAPITSDSARLDVIHHGTATLFDVTVQITDLAIFRKIKNNNFKDAQIFMNFNTINAHTAITGSSIKSDFSTHFKEFNLQFSARNGAFTQMIRLYKKDGKWLYATRIKSFTDSKIFFEKIDPLFPKDLIKWK